VPVLPANLTLPLPAAELTEIFVRGLSELIGPNP